MWDSLNGDRWFMSEEQVMDITISREDLSDHDTGGAIRVVKAEITIDSSLPLLRQREALIHEILGVYLGILVNTEDICEIACAISNGINQWEVSDEGS